MVEVVEKLVGVVLRWSSIELRRDVVDLVRRGGFFLHSLMEKRASGREELLCEKKDYRKGRGRWLRWESDGAWTRAGIRGSTSLQRRHAHRWFTRAVREGEADSGKKKIA